MSTLAIQLDPHAVDVRVDDAALHFVLADGRENVHKSERRTDSVAVGRHVTCNHYAFTAAKQLTHSLNLGFLNYLS